MFQKNLRTYRRRSVSRTSGYHTCDETTGGECIIKNSELYSCRNENETFIFNRNHLELIELFGKGISIIAFGGYVYTRHNIEIYLEMNYTYENRTYTKEKKYILDANEWKNIGFHSEIIMNKSSKIHDAIVKMKIKTPIPNTLEFISFDFNIVSKEEFIDESCSVSFYQKTYMHVPYLYYLSTDLPFNKYLTVPTLFSFNKGRFVVLKSCNRCGRYLPINIEDEMKTLSFSLHCKKNAPCKHSTFRGYRIINRPGNEIDLKKYILHDSIISYYGHQLECKACKKFFVNAPLNPQRNPQQFKEDGLRRRAIEVLVNTLLNRNLVHFEFENKTKREFSKYIWEKFDKRCFKCGPTSRQIELHEMALDHTLPLAYLYRLDETATCLCSSHNSQKSDHFPIDYYSKDELKRLSSITGLTYEQLSVRKVNQQVLELLIKNVVWFFDDFLMNKDYQKIRDGIKTADKIHDALKRIIAGKVNLIEEYEKRTGKKPISVTIKQ